MKGEAAAGSTGRQEWSDKRRACLVQAARRLGADDQAAKAFADDGMTVVEGFALHLIALGPGDGPWVACMKVQRPEGVSEADWFQALLVANGHALMVEDWAFGLEDDDAGVLMMPMAAGVPHERHLAARLEGMLTMCRGVVGGATALRDMRSSTEDRR